MLTENIKKEIKKQALLSPKEEICGFILADGTVFPCINRATDKEIHFIISAADMKKARKRGEGIAIYHSHVPGNYGEDRFSENDIVISEYFNLEAVLYSVKDDKFYEYHPTGKPIGYLNRPYIRNIMDEFHLIRDYYKNELNIIVNINSKNYKESLKNKNITIEMSGQHHENFLKSNNFVKVGELQKHDILIIKWQNDINKKQMSIYLGNDKLMIHREFDVSQIVEYNYGLKNWTEKIFRYHKM